MAIEVPSVPVSDIRPEDDSRVKAGELAAEAAPATIQGFAACTILSKNYISYARTLAASFSAHHPGCPFFVLLSDRADGYFEPARERFHLIKIEQLTIPNLPRFCFQYSLVELNTAVKPYFLSYLLDNYAMEKLVYFDPDIVIRDNLSQLSGLLDRHSIILTPHLTGPIDDNRRPNELDILQAGAYNLGFLAIARGPVTKKFLEWWEGRLYSKCQIAPEEGMFVDQRWVDLVPGLFDGVYILRDPRYNVAYWNLHSRTIDFAHGRLTVDGQPCMFFHFSGFNPDNPGGLSKHQDRFSLKSVGRLGGLFLAYREQLLANGYRETSKWPYAFACFTNGARIPDIARAMYRALGEEVVRFGDPFVAEADKSFFRWLQEGVDRSSDPADTVPRLWYEIYHQRPDLQRGLRDILGADRRAFLSWIAWDGQKELNIDERFAPHVRGGAAAVGARTRTAWPSTVYTYLLRPLKPLVKPLLKLVFGRRPSTWNRLRRARDHMRDGRPPAYAPPRTSQRRVRGADED